MKAFSSRWLRLAVNHLTGELHLGEANAVVGSRLEARLAQASKIATFSAGKLVDNLLMTRSLVSQSFGRFDAESNFRLDASSFVIVLKSV